MPVWRSPSGLETSLPFTFYSTSPRFLFAAHRGTGPHLRVPPRVWLSPFDPSAHLLKTKHKHKLNTKERQHLELLEMRPTTLLMLGTCVLTLATTFQGPLVYLGTATTGIWQHEGKWSLTVEVTLL